jgi:hypothetical protein
MAAKVGATRRLASLVCELSWRYQGRIQAWTEPQERGALKDAGFPPPSDGLPCVVEATLERAVSKPGTPRCSAPAWFPGRFGTALAFATVEKKR